MDKEFNSVLEKIQKKRMFIVRYDSSLPVNKGSVPTVDPKNIFNIDPIRILYFMKEHLRTIDLFLKFDKDSSNSLTRDEMQFAFEVRKYLCFCAFNKRHYSESVIWFDIVSI